MKVLIAKLFRVNRPVVVHPEYGIPATIAGDVILWLVSSRKSKLGGYIGTFETTYRHGDSGVYSPSGRYLFCLGMDAVTPIA